ncbi:MAG: molecular chaperone TorD family protein [Gordonibacter sp.]
MPIEDEPIRIEDRPTLAAWLDEYASIENDYIAALQAEGIVFEDRDEHADATAQVVCRLHEKGAHFRSGTASVYVNWVSSACEACAGCDGSMTFFLSLRCNKNCYFCFNPNQQDYNLHVKTPDEWKAEFDEFARTSSGVTHVGLTGGEPLLHPREALDFLAYVRERCPQAHTRLYTAGDLLDDDLLRRLADAGLAEIRFSIKLDDGQEAVRGTLAKIARAKEFIADVMVEMPVIPGTEDVMREVLASLDRIGIAGINLLEFCFPLNRWDEFERRGFKVKNPPFNVLYDYGYAGGLPVAQSELGCLELMEYALDAGLGLGVHYCSLDNKNRDQIYQQNTAVQLDPDIYELLPNEYFYHTAKVFDQDVAVAKRVLESNGLSASCLEEGGACLAFHPRHAHLLFSSPVKVALSYNVVESGAEGPCVRELGLYPVDFEGVDACMTDSEKWQIKATAWEFLALSLRYPDAVLADAVASGEWLDAAREIICALGRDVPDGFGEGLADCVAALEADASEDPVRGAGVSGAGELEAAGSAAPGREAVDAEALLHALRAEATRLFVGAPEPAVSPYEGVHRAQGDGVQALLFVNPHSMEVERFARACGLGRPAGTNEPLDHVATECELLEHLALRAAGAASVDAAPTGPEAADLLEGAPDRPVPDDALPGGSPEAAYGRFLEEHACAWMPGFAEAVAGQTREPLYRAAAAMLALLAESRGC